jgi:transcriptional regulator with PAS, ATPase and Fis domain
MQAKLLRFLQDFEVRPVGSAACRKVDVRVVAATHQNLRRMVEERRFREDLFYRLAMVQIRLPRLVDRLEDLPLLVRHFLTRFAEQYQKPGLALSTRAQALIGRYSWPGNVRELESVLSYASMMAEESLIDIRHLPEHLHMRITGGDGDEGELVTIEEVQRRHALRILEKVHGNRTQAAELLGISRATLYRLLERTAASD